MRVWRVQCCAINAALGELAAAAQLQSRYANPADVARRALRKLEAVHVAAQLSDLRVPPGNRLHALKGNRAGQHAIAVNDQWRICFRFADGDAYDVEFCDDH